MTLRVLGHTPQNLTLGHGRIRRVDGRIRRVEKVVGRQRAAPGAGEFEKLVQIRVDEPCVFGQRLKKLVDVKRLERRRVVAHDEEGRRARACGDEQPPRFGEACGAAVGSYRSLSSKRRAFRALVAMALVALMQHEARRAEVDPGGGVPAQEVAE